MATPASDPENGKWRHTEKGAISIFLTALPSPSPLEKFNFRSIGRAPPLLTPCHSRSRMKRQWGGHPLFCRRRSPKPASFLPSSSACSSPPPPAPRHTILNKHAWPGSMWEFWRVTIVISRNAQTPAKIHFPDAWLF